MASEVMPYTVEVTLADAPSPKGDDDLPMYQLPDTFDTIAAAKDAAERHVAGLTRDPATVMFTVMDQEGLVVGSNAPT